MGSQVTSMGFGYIAYPCGFTSFKGLVTDSRREFSPVRFKPTLSPKLCSKAGNGFSPPPSLRSLVMDRSSLFACLYLAGSHCGCNDFCISQADYSFFISSPYIFWTLVTGPILLKGWRETPVYGFGFIVGFYVTMILSLVAMILIFGTVRRLGPRINRILLGISALALFCFGWYQLWLGVIS